MPQGAGARDPVLFGGRKAFLGRRHRRPVRRAGGAAGRSEGDGGRRPTYRSPNVSYRMFGGGTSSSARARSVDRTIRAEPET
ncbi:hypothetical protein GA0070563_12251 [Micromonospora carbonacea]|uniref:Uncharacterized protein n=1 Tax=Micromonospora carbonacea TaxID=47853 RepID=A0A1C5AW47_9ACTN|nr:hypothetical protein GA0070563_12251 [Micromonospora carbonacea]